MRVPGFDVGRGDGFLIWAALCLAFSFAAGVAKAEPAPGEAAPIYDPGTVSVVDIGLAPEAIDALEEEPDEYVEGTFALAFTDGTPGGEEETIELAGPVGVRLKGGTGSFRPLSGKAAFKLKFNEYAKQRFLGLKKLTLNNMVQDPSMIHETLAYTMFRAAGVPASRTGYAYVRVNGEDFGTYLNVEALDDVGLERWFGELDDDSQHLYEGEYGTDVTPGGAAAFSVDEGDEAVRTDLEALIAAVADGGGAFSERIEGLANLGEMTRMWAGEKYAGHWDGYAGADSSQFPGGVMPNNFYLFSDAAGEFQMLPWGTDQTWSSRLDFGAGAGLLFDECLADPACRSMYRESLVEVGETVEALELDPLAEATAAMLGPWQALGASREEHGFEEIEEGVAETRDFIAERPAELDGWLSSQDEPSPSSSSAPLAPVDHSDRALRVGRAAVAEGVLTTRLNLPGAGTLSKRVMIRTRDGVVVVCATRVRARAPGRAVLRCRLSRSARQRLAARWLRLWVGLDFASDDGGRESRNFNLVVRRAAA